MDNMTYWNNLKQPPRDAMKEIRAGRLKGMSDINPQWRLEAMTAQFGPVGIGWKYTIEKLWNEIANSEQVFAFALVNLFIKDGEDWSAPVPGIGGSMLITKESAGLHASDEGYKMAVTDALSVAMKALGVGADIYRGRWDGSKYKDAPASDKTTVDKYKEEVEKITSPTPDEMRQEMSDWFIKQYGSDAMLKFSEMTNGTFAAPDKIKTDKNVAICYDKYLQYKEGK
jgi:hypothetical protein